MNRIARHIALYLLLMVAWLPGAGQRTPETEVPLPTVPDSLREPRLRADYIVEHFWDNAALLTEYPCEAFEQAFANWISVFPLASEEAREDAFRTLVNRAVANGAEFTLLTDIAHKYLYENDSPVASDDFYILFLKATTESDKIDESLKIRPLWLLSALSKNRPGTEASDFRFECRDGRQTSLYDELGRLTHDNPAAILYLIFYDPDCDHCREVMSKLLADEAFCADVAARKTKVIAIYSGEDRDLWEQTAPQLPTEWTVGYDDGTIQDDEVYFIRELPAIYIIGTDAIVTAKDLRLD